MSEKLLNFMLLILRLKLRENGQSYKFKYSIDEFKKIILFTQGYNEDLKNMLKVFIEFSKYCKNIVERITEILEQDIISYEISLRNKKYIKIVNNSFVFITESFLRVILIFSSELIKNDKNKFKEFYSFLNMANRIFQNLNSKFSLFSKEIKNIENLIKVEEFCQSNKDEFQKNYDKIIWNLLNQSNSLCQSNYYQFYEAILDQVKIIDKIFIEKNDKYKELLFFLCKQNFITLKSEELKLDYIAYFIKNKLILDKMKLFLSFILNDMKPQLPTKRKPSDVLLNEFMNLENIKYNKLNNFIKICNEIYSPVFNEVLLYFFEGQSQSYFLEILNKYDNNYSLKCCEELLLNISLSYFKKAYFYLDENNCNNILKFYAIAYIKTYCYFYVEINYNYYDECNFDEINKIFDLKDTKNKLFRNMVILYFWRLYYKKFKNFDEFKSYNFMGKNIPFLKELIEKLNNEKRNSNSS